MKKLIIVLALITAVGLGYFIFNKKEKSISKQPQLYVVNVLDKELYSDCHIKGSINIPFDQVEQFANKVDKDDHIIFYCSNYMCTASGASARLFSKLGFKNVWAYEAGMADWYQNKLPVEGVCKESYLNLKFPAPEEQPKDVQLITTQQLKDKINDMLKLNL